MSRSQRSLHPYTYTETETVGNHPAVAVSGAHPQRAQSALEYAVLTAILAAALIGMSVYVKRGFSGRMRDAADSVGEQYAPTGTRFTQTLTASSTTTTKSKLVKDKELGDGTTADVMVTTTTIADDTTTRTGHETVEPLGTSLWE